MTNTQRRQRAPQAGPNPPTRLEDQELFRAMPPHDRVSMDHEFLVALVPEAYTTKPTFGGTAAVTQESTPHIIFAL